MRRASWAPSGMKEEAICGVVSSQGAPAPSCILRGWKGKEMLVRQGVRESAVAALPWGHGKCKRHVKKEMQQGTSEAP